MTDLYEFLESFSDDELLSDSFIDDNYQEIYARYGAEMHKTLCERIPPSGRRDLVLAMDDINEFKKTMVSMCIENIIVFIVELRADELRDSDRND